LLSLLSSFAFGQAERSESAPNREGDEKAIKDVLRDFADAWNRRDAKAFSLVFAEDADFTNVVGMSAQGRG
jgi:ketosteroid isomerase-like protein